MWKLSGCNKLIHIVIMWNSCLNRGIMGDHWNMLMFKKQFCFPQGRNMHQVSPITPVGSVTLYDLAPPVVNSCQFARNQCDKQGASSHAKFLFHKGASSFQIFSIDSSLHVKWTQRICETFQLWRQVTFWSLCTCTLKITQGVVHKKDVIRSHCLQSVFRKFGMCVRAVGNQGLRKAVEGRKMLVGLVIGLFFCHQDSELDNPYEHHGDLGIFF